MPKLPTRPKTGKTIYLDHAAATPTDSRVIKAMAPFWSQSFANPSALYKAGVKNREAVEQAREAVAKNLKTQARNILFTSGGTEANNLAIFGLILELKKKQKKIHVITTAIEHHSVLNPCKELTKQGIEVTFLPVNECGEISIKELLGAIKPHTALISVMYANNEIGTINPIAEIGRELLKYRKNNKTTFPFFHTDACQAAGTLDLAVDKLHVDLLTLNGSKIYGPKGSGVLFVRPGVTLAPLLFGGDQENGLRSGTENVSAIIGLAKALEIAGIGKEKESKREQMLRDYFWNEIKKKIPEAKLNGPEISVTKNSKAPKKYQIKESNRLANNVNVCFPGTEGETVALYLDAYGICAATGSACATDQDDASHVLVACGKSTEEAKSSLRFSLGRSTTKKDIDTVMKYLPGLVKMLR